MPTDNANPEPTPVSAKLKSERIGAQLSGAQIAERLTSLPGWQMVDGDKVLQRTFELPSLRAAVAFVAYVAELAEAAGHHPDELRIRGSNVTVSLTTQSVGGLTDEDFALATRVHAGRG